jgi:hypothetical protein
MVKKLFAFLPAALLVSMLLAVALPQAASAQSTRAAHPATTVSPKSCQPASVEVVLEGSQRGHLYQCTGSYAVNDSTYYIFANSWSGYISRADGTWLFCDGDSFSMPLVWTYSIYLSPVKEPWC